jgi:uncharacterized membrane protein
VTDYGRSWVGATTREAQTGEKETGDMSSNAIQVFVAAYQSEDAAGAALKDFRAMNRAGSIELIDAAVAVHRADGKVKIEETADPSGKTWGKRGAIAGGVVGLIFPPSIIASALVGGAGGGIWGKLRDKGFKDEDLKAIGESLPPGSSAIIAIAEDRVVERLQQGLEGYERIARHALSADAAAVIVAEADEAPAEDAE